LNQTYKDLEIILVDDGSTDFSGSICDEYAKKDDRVRAIHKENGGLSSARNAGLDVAKGDYIGFIDSDDYINENMYERLLNELEAQKADLCICCFEYIYENPDQKRIDVVPFDETRVFSKDEILFKLIENNNSSVQYVTAVNRLYRKEIFEGLRFEEGRVHEDEFIAHQVYDKCNRVIQITDKLYCYLQRYGSITNSGFSIKRLDAAYAFYNRYLYFKHKKIKFGKKKSILQTYGILIAALNQLNYKENKKYILPIAKKLVFNFDLSWRALRLLFLLIKKACFS
jgi:glycosyltransferase involved in cell wall biosynthesis